MSQVRVKWQANELRPFLSPHYQGLMRPDYQVTSGPWSCSLTLEEWKEPNDEFDEVVILHRVQASKRNITDTQSVSLDSFDDIYLLSASVGCDPYLPIETMTQSKVRVGKAKSYAPGYTHVRCGQFGWRNTCLRKKRYRLGPRRRISERPKTSGHCYGYFGSGCTPGKTCWGRDHNANGTIGSATATAGPASQSQGWCSTVW